MRSFNANFITEKNKRSDGPAPINLLTFGFATPVQLSDRDIDSFGNSVVNGDMELDSNWKDFSTPPINERSSEQVHGGTYSRKFTADWGWDGIQSDDFATETGQEYRLTWYAYSTNTMQRFTIREGDGSGENFSGTFGGLTPNAWNKLTYSYTEAAGGSQAYVSFSAFVAGDVNYVDDVVVGAIIAHTGLIKDWGFIDSSIAQIPGRGVLGRIETPDLKLIIINTESPRFSDNFTSDDPPENVTVELYQWFNGLPYSEKETIFKGIILGQPKYDEYTCTLVIRGIWEKYNKKIGEDLIVTADDFPSADPDDIGKMRNIAYGDLKNIRCRAIKAGAVDNLKDDINATVTTIEVSGGGKVDLPSSGTVQIDDEQITYTGKTGNQLTGCTRGVNSTTAVAHNKGASVAEVLTEYIYEVASHPVKSLGDIYVDGVRQAADFTAYTGQAGDELAGYEDTAVVKFTVAPVVKRQVHIDIEEDIEVDDTIGVTQGSHSHAQSDVTIAWMFDTGTTHAGSPDYPENAADQNLNRYADVPGSSDQIKVQRGCYQEFPGTPKKFRVCGKSGNVEGGWSFSFGGRSVSFSSAEDYTVKKGSWYDVPASLDTWAEWNSAYGIASCTNTAADNKIAEVWVEIQYTPTSPASAASGVGKSGEAKRDQATGASLVGNSSADTVIGKVVTVNGEGYQDDASGTYTGTPNALIERPDHVKKHLWSETLGAPSGDIDTPSFDASGSFYSTNNYKFSLLINRPILAEELFMKLALQCRSRFFVTPYGKAKLIVRQLSQTSGHSIPKKEIKRDSMSVERSTTTDLINLFNIHYDRDHSQESNAAKYYQAVKKFSDSTSISTYGQREWKGRSDIFLFDAVTLAAMAQHVGDFLLDYHKTVRKMPHFGVFLDNMEIEPADIIDVTHPLDSMTGFTCEVLKILHHLGSARKNVIDHLEIVTVEN